MEKKVYEKIHTFTGDEVEEWRNCQVCGIEFPVSHKDKKIYEAVSPVIGDVKYYVPFPKYCGDCRQQRKRVFRNESKLYRRNCDFTGKTIVSNYSPDIKGKVYDKEVWWSDKWDPMQYGRDFDFSRPFFEQFKELLDEVPKMALTTFLDENSPYINFGRKSKNCHLCFDIGYCENVLYGKRVYHSSNVLDCLDMENCENCYDCINCKDSYKLFFSRSCKSCRESYFLKDCENCEFCFNCVGLVNKQYCINNVQYSKEEYNKFMESVDFGSYENLENLKKDHEDFASQFPVKSWNMLQCENCVGDYIFGSKDVVYGIEVNNSEDSRYVYRIDDALKNSIDINNASEGELLYNGTTVNGYQIFCSRMVAASEHILYSDNCFNSSNLFGCVGLQNKQYCILNKQYSKEEYQKLVPQIIEHMKKHGERGEFFPPEFSPFGYNETVAYDYYPLSREEAIQKGFKRMDKQYPINVPENMERIDFHDLPDNIRDVGDDFLNKAIVGKNSDVPFRLTKQELAFYRKYNLPLPRDNSEERFKERMAKLNKRDFFIRDCDKCDKEILSTHPDNTKEPVYCPACYEKEIYG